MRTFITFTLGSGILFSVAGCVPQQKYDDMLNAYRSKEQQVHEAQAEIETLRSNERMLREQLQNADNDFKRAISQLDSREMDIDQLRMDYEAFKVAVDNLETVALPATLNMALKKLSDQHAELLSYDPETGMLRFSSDLTFELGSASLSSAAKQTLSQLAAILNSADAMSFEAQVVGHTDNVPIRRPATRAKHPTNVHLSAHRAISVRNAMVNDGISANRVQIAGYGEYRPIAPNGTKGAAANRRVEIYLQPMPAEMLTAAPATTEEESTRTVVDPAEEEPLK